MNKMGLLKERVLNAESNLNEKIISQYPYLDGVIEPEIRDDLLYILKTYDEYNVREKEYLVSGIEEAFSNLPNDEYEAFTDLIIYLTDPDNAKVCKFFFDKVEPNPNFIINFLCLCFTSPEFCARIDINAQNTNRLYCVRKSPDKVEATDIYFPSDLLEKLDSVSDMFQPVIDKDNRH